MNESISPEKTDTQISAAAALNDDFGCFSKRVAERYFTSIPIQDQTISTIREAEKNGDVVHVMHTSNILGALFLTWLLPFQGLKPLRTAIGIERPFLWKPLKKLLHRGSCSNRLNGALDGDHSALVFLNTASGLVPRPTPLADPFFSLIDRAKKSSRPLYLIPETFVWSARPPSLRPGLKEFLLGSAEAPHRLISAWGFVINHKNNETHFVLFDGDLHYPRLERQRPVFSSRYDLGFSTEF